jgi:uncharacterized membrane protein YqgA involved in biofilm formation
MMADFTAVGGLLLLATGLRIWDQDVCRGEHAARLLLAMPLSALRALFRLRMRRNGERLRR